MRSSGRGGSEASEAAAVLTATTLNPMQRWQHFALEQLPQLEERDKRARLEVRALLAAASLGHVLQLVVDGLQAVVEGIGHRPIIARIAGAE